MQLGFRAVSTRQIADACGLTQPALYHHFSDKQTIYIEVLRSVCEETRGSLERIIERNTSVVEQLYEVAEYLIANHPEDLSRMFHDIRHELSAESQALVFRLWRGAYLLPIVGIFEQGRQSGQLRESTQFGIDANMSAGLLMGLISQSMASPIIGASPAAAAAAAAAAAPAASPQEGSPIKKNTKQLARMLVNVLLFGLSTAEPPSV
ncbi:TetR family transcriptional regulator [Paenibacillus taihuensis]|uniref:TetR family transcriptional regulator n=2 Tax=Paenibacillus taihuensis TaxID=1156355 RepID=A0A3D9Q731_9BACL|nr:TetR family transcriptional regulator [Paenibacillus taihuensis]